MHFRSFHRIQKTLIHARHFSKKPDFPTREAIENMSFFRICILSIQKAIWADDNTTRKMVYC